MTSSYYKISLNIHDHVSNVSLKAKKGDTGRVLQITLIDGSKPYVITSDCYAVFTAKKADGNVLYNRCSILGNTITYAFTPQTTSAVGNNECEIKLYGADSKLLISAGFTLVVEDTAYDDGDELKSVSEVTALTALVHETTTLIRDVEGRLASGAFVGAKGDKGDRGEKGDRGIRGEKGERGERGAQGIGGVIAPTKGYFALEVNSATGDLYCVTDGGTTAPTFSLDTKGNIYYEIKED